MSQKNNGSSDKCSGTLSREMMTPQVYSWDDYLKMCQYVSHDSEFLWGSFGVFKNETVALLQEAF